MPAAPAAPSLVNICPAPIFLFLNTHPMSRIDQLMLVVELLERKSCSIVDKSHESVALVQNISRLYDKWTQEEHHCAHLHSEAAANFLLLTGFRTLDEKLFLLDASLNTSDVYTSSMSLENLKNEYHYMLKNPDIDTHEVSFAELPRKRLSAYLPCALKHSLNPYHTHLTSTNLPSTNLPSINLPSINRQSSLHRFLQSFTLPLPAALPGLPHKSSIADLKLKPIKCRTSQPYKKKSKYRLSQIYTLNPVVDTSFESLSPERYVSKASQASEPLSQHTHNQTASTLPTTFEDEREASDANVTIELEKDLDAFHIHGHEPSPDRVSASSLLSLSPPLEFDNFNDFLRKSRLDLQASPPKLKRSTSHDSIFHEAKVKFHNPAEKISLKSDVVTPTFESISCQESARESSSKLLAEMIQKADLQPISKTPTKQPFALGLGSPLQPTLSHVTSSPPRRNSVSKALASSFFSLMAPTPSVDFKRENVPTTPKSTNKPKKTVAAPVMITSEAQRKRLPLHPVSFNGAHSKLLIDKNAAVICHGLSAAIRRPIMTRVSHNSLNEALSSSIK